MAPTFADVYAEKYLLLTTFTKDGRPKPTPVWGVPDGDRLLIITDDGSWKTKRINNTARVTIQKCGVLGKPKGEPVRGGRPQPAESADPAGLEHGHQTLLVARVVVGAARDHPRRRGQGAQRDRGDRTVLTGQVCPEEREHAPPGVLGRVRVVAELREAQKRLGGQPVGEAVPGVGYTLTSHGTPLAVSISWSLGPAPTPSGSRRPKLATTGHEASRVSARSLGSGVP